MMKDASIENTKLHQRDNNTANTDAQAIAWQTLDDTVVYDNPWICVRHQNVVRPDGSPGIYGVVNFKSHAVGVVALDDDGNTWLVQQSRYTLHCKTWEIPEGGVPLDELPLDGAKRELREETGLSAGHWQEILQLHTSNSVTDEAATVFLARDLSAGEQALEASEDIVVNTLPLTEAVAMVERGDITDAISVAALLKVARMLDM